MIDTATGATTANIRVVGSGWSSPSDVVVSPDGTRAYTANPDLGSVSVIDTATNTVTATVAAPGTTLVVSPDGRKVYVTGQGAGSVTVIDTATNTVSARIPVAGYQGIAVTPDGSRVYVSHWSEHGVSVIDTATNRVVAVVPTTGGCYGLAVHPDGTRVYVADNEAQIVSVINTATNTISRSIGVGSPPTGVAVTPDGAGVYVGCEEGPVSLIDSVGNKVVATIPVWDAGALAVSPDGTFVYVPDYSKHTLSVINVAGNTVTGTVAVGPNPCSVAFGPGVPLRTDTPTVVKGAPLKVRYSTVPGNVRSTNWVGVYPDDGGATIGKKNSFVWAYAPNAAGSVTLDTGGVPGPGRYAAWYLYNDGYTTLAGPLTFTVT
ncbi:YncE family protein [Microtetraspora niveoalba]|uniref:YncE family protein n=1 Tax=Microtetraspora niveoalba TaxID=46175 RepID=UPI001FDF58FF